MKQPAKNALTYTGAAALTGLFYLISGIPLVFLAGACLFLTGCVGIELAAWGSSRRKG